MRRTVFSIAVVFAGALTAATWVDAAPPAAFDAAPSAQERAVRLPTTSVPREPGDTDRALLISDSAWLGMPYYSGVDQVQGFEHTLALASCRRRVVTSCTNYNGFVPITMYDEIDTRGSGYTTLIVATGYNDSGQRFADEVETIVTLARSHGYERVVWLTLRSNVAYTSPGEAGFAEVFEGNNETLQQIVEDDTYPDLVVADWATYARERPGWFAADGIHLRRLGGYAAGDYLSRKMAFLDRRACAQPAYAGVEPLDPCPDPDEHGPLIDLESLYPVDRSQGFGFTLEFEGSSSWPNPPWWE